MSQPENELRAALEDVLEIGCWQSVLGTEDWKCRWCSQIKHKDPTTNAPHLEDCSYMVARAALASRAPATTPTSPSADETLPAGVCYLCKHSLEDNAHGFDQNDAEMDGDELVHSGRCTYCKICHLGTPAQPSGSQGE